jgi:S1-C subfamily serine protease
MGYSLLINEAMVILNQLLEAGTVQTPYLGVISYFEVDETIKDLYNIPSVGVFVRALDENGAAAEAGIMERDLIVAFDGVPLSTGEALREAIAQRNVGDRVIISLYRGHEPMEIAVTIGNLNDR